MITERRRFGRTGLAVSPLGFGASPIGVHRTDSGEIESVVSRLLDAGVNLIDTAAGYYTSEERLGVSMSRRRDEYILVSKCGRALDHIEAPEWTAENVFETIERSLERLRTDYLDVMLLHTCPLEVLQHGEAIDALVEARAQGRIRHAGFSGDNDAAVFAAGHPEIDVIQISLNITDQANIDSVLPVAVEHDVGVMAKRPLANGAWKDDGEQHTEYLNYAGPYRERFLAMGLDDASFGMSWAETALRFALAIDGVHTAIAGTTNARHADANVAMAMRGALDRKAVTQLRTAFEQAEPEAGWPGLT